MATVTGLTAARMLEIEDASVVDGDVVGDNLILTKHDGSTINAGNVRGPAGTGGAAGAAGAQGPPGLGGAIPGEIRLWSGSAVPLLATYGKWVWADGAVYVVATYPLSASHINAAWRTFNGASDPGGSNFRVPDLRGLVPVGMDAMPGGAAAGRMTRGVAITLAGRTGEETHVVTVAEMPSHDHGGGNHTHVIESTNHESFSLPHPAMAQGSSDNLWNRSPSEQVRALASGAVIAAQGGANGHENVQPSVFVPYIVCLAG